MIPMDKAMAETAEKNMVTNGGDKRPPQENLSWNGGDFATVPGFTLGVAEEPWYKSLYRSIKELVRPEKLPPLEVTSKPVPVKEIWKKDPNASKARLTSFAIHVAVVVLLFTASTSPVVQETVRDTVTLIAPDLAPYIPRVDPKPMGGGGGGGDQSPTPPTKGKLPKFELRQFTPPQAVPNNPQPKLIAEPSLVIPPDLRLPNPDLPNYGDALAKILGPPSNGPGWGGGIGTGKGTGVGSGEGPGLGPGRGGGYGGGVFRVGGGVTAPVLIYKVEPEYSEEARKAKFQGTVVLYLEVDERGYPQNIRVIRPLGLGLDEKAIEAVKQWRFKPGMKDGKPVRVAATVEVNFRLL